MATYLSKLMMIIVREDTDVTKYSTKKYSLPSYKKRKGNLTLEIIEDNKEINF